MFDTIGMVLLQYYCQIVKQSAVQIILNSTLLI